MEIMPALDSVDAMITDPPYCSGGMYRGDRTKPVSEKYKSGRSLCRNSFAHDAKDQRAFMNWCVEWLNRAPLREASYVLSFIDWRNLPALTDAFQLAGLMWRGLCPWDKGLGSRAPHKGYARHQAEYVVWGTSGPCAVAAHGGPWPGVYRHTVLQSDKHHIAGKPTPLLEDLVVWVPESGVVLDAFMGSGTTGVACIRTGRRFVGIEIDPAHYATACARIEKAWAEAQDSPTPGETPGEPSAGETPALQRTL
jgi:site-specific DNA-methyltransferase (adenine-specific)